MERTTQGGDAQAGRQATTTLPGVAKRPQLFFFSNSYLPCHDAYIHRLLISVRYLPSAIFKGTRTDARREIYEWLVLSRARRSYPRFRLKPPPSFPSPSVNQRPRCSAYIPIIHPPLAKEGKKKKKGERERDREGKKLARALPRFRSFRNNGWDGVGKR